MTRLLLFSISFLVKNKSLFWQNILVICLSSHLPATYAQSRDLQSINHSSLMGNRIQISLEFAGQAPTPSYFTTDNPARIVLDFPNTSLSATERSLTIGTGTVQGVRAVETNQKVRLVVNLLEKTQFRLQNVDNKLLVLIDPPSGGHQQVNSDPVNNAITSVNTQAENNTMVSASNASYSVPAAANSTSHSPAFTRATMGAYQAPSLSNIDFRRHEDSSGWILIDLSHPNIIVDMNRTSGREIQVVFFNTELPGHLDKRLDVLDFDTPISTIDTFSEGKNVKMLIKIREGITFDYTSTLTDKTYTIKVNRKSVEADGEGLRRKDPVYTGKKVNFSFQKINVRAALDLLLSPEVSGENYNVVVNDGVQGELTLTLRNVPWDQALDIILEARSLGQRRFGNVIIIDTKASLDAREKAELAAKKEIKELEPVRTHYIQINYSKAKDIETLLSKKNAADAAQSFLSSRGTVSIDERTNTLILQDTEDRLEEIRKLVEALDKPVRQVLIESRIVIATETFSKQLGVKFGYSLNQSLGSEHGLVFGGKMAGDTTYGTGTAFDSNNTTPSLATSGGSINTAAGTTENYLVNLPIDTIGGGGALGLAIGKIGSYLLQLELAAAQSEGMTEVLSTPRVVTANQQKAIIRQGKEIPYRTISQAGTTTTFKPAELKLEVTPQITPDDRIIMALNVSSDDVSQTTNDGNLAIDTRGVTTQVLVDNGETVVLGGVFQQSKGNTVTRIPFFGDLPVVGNLFKSTKDSSERRELLIFVTPKILGQSES